MYRSCVDSGQNLEKGGKENKAVKYKQQKSLALQM